MLESLKQFETKNMEILSELIGPQDIQAQRLVLIQQLLNASIDRMRKNETTVPMTILQAYLLTVYLLARQKIDTKSPFVQLMIKQNRTDGPVEHRLMSVWQEGIIQNMNYLAGHPLQGQSMAVPFRDPLSVHQRDFLVVMLKKLEKSNNTEEELMDAVITSMCLIDANNMNVPIEQLDDPKKCAKELSRLIRMRLYGKSSEISITQIALASAGLIGIGAACYVAYQHWKK
eukprot:TRINITY_DN2028_c0_g1_i4.p1 TRINITY_DN2028_c0_g1~~TRINITY_DN2028_c0_g1_i4.p1  ORF type:complete len:230 (+),score=52.77 TRINITY_DN2028_c0_g1_i4:50-739(+)